MNKTTLLFLFVLCMLLAFTSSGCVKTAYSAADFKIFADGQAASIYVDADAPTVCRIAADLLSEDIERVCGTKAPVVHSTDGLSGHVIFIGIAGNTWLSKCENKPDVSDIKGQWESWVTETVEAPLAGVEKGLFIIGSDRRGAAFGVFDLSQQIGVSPWYWWADVPVEHRDTIIVQKGRVKQGPPSVRYRGIFINDEDWGLQPWAAKTYAPEDGDLGPKTYAKVFELLLRLKANYLWPGMHDCTRAFNYFEANKKVADDYAIVMGSSHCEQMLRNNVDEWHRWQPAEGDRGEWDWCTNSEQIVEYWRDRVEENAAYDNIYTMGMRGIHDSGMPCSGASKAEKVEKMQNELIPAQRKLLAEYVNPDASKVPQIFCPYKEVLELYDMGLQLPEDITIVWPDDNHGYIRRLSNTAERARGGGGGVYYHISYWGSPHDFLWLNSTPPALVWEEMSKAYAYGADRVWVLNVGDIKPGEIGMDFFLQMGWDIDRWNETNLDRFLEQWAEETFGAAYSQEIAAIMTEYYQLAQSRKPEHMGFGTIYPTTPNGEPGFSPIHYGDQSQQRIDRYLQIENKAKTILEKLPSASKDAFYQLVYYPVRGASLMNQKFLYAQKSRLYAKQGRVSANDYALRALEALAVIVNETAVYNNELAGGKWKEMMTWNPRRLPVFQEPQVGGVLPADEASIGVAIEGQIRAVSDAEEPALPFSDDFSDGKPGGWEPMNPDRWEVRAHGEQTEYAINTTDFANLAGDRLGALSVIEDRYYDKFGFRCRVRSCDDLGSNESADFAFVFGYVDAQNYTYLILSSNASNSGLYRVAGGRRSLVQMANDAEIGDNEFHPLDVKKTDAGLTIRYNDRTILSTTAPFAGGNIGVGSYNDAAAFTDIEITPLEGGSSVDTLPVFNAVTQSRHFVDIFNKGKTAFDWTAKASAPWVKLSDTSGTIDTEQRIWVSVDWDTIPAGEHAARITIAGAGQSVPVQVEAVKPETLPKEGFVQVNGVVSMEAEHFTSQINNNSASWKVIADLGSSGDAVMILPVTSPSRNPDALGESPALEYSVYLQETGEVPVTVYCLPTHAITNEHGLRYAVSFDDTAPQVVDFDTTEWSGPWSVNVLRGAAVTTTIHNVEADGKHTLKIRMVDPGVVIDRIVIGRMSADYLGPPETQIVK